VPSSSSLRRPALVLGTLALLFCPAFALDDLARFTESRQDVAEWTIAVYLDADNDLEQFGLIDMNEMEAGLAGDVNVIVLIDRAEGYDTSDGDWTDARVYRITADKDMDAIRSPVIARPGELNMGDPAVLETFLAATLTHFPARRTALVLWNHGGGWQAHAIDHGIPGQEHGTDYLTVPQLAGAVRGALDRAGRERLDIVGFDMCLMAQYEVAVELADLAAVLIASQATEPGDGWPYDRLLPAFAEKRRKTADLAVHIVDVFDAYYRERDEAITTLSAFDLRKLGDFTAGFDRVLARLEPALTDLWPAVSRAIFFAEGYAPRTELQRGKESLASIDLLDALRRIEQNAPAFPARGELRALEKVYAQMLLVNRTSPLRRLSTGLAIYAPVTAAVLNEQYDDLAASTASGWRRFLDRLHALQAAQSRPPVVRDLQLVDWKAGRTTEQALPLNTHGAAYVVEGTNLLWLRGLQGQWDDRGEGLLVLHRAEIVDANWSTRARDLAADQLDLMIPQFQDGANQLVTQLDGYRYLVSGGGPQAYYATVDESGEFIQVPVVYHHPEAGDLDGTIYFHPRWWYAVALEVALRQPDGSVVYRQLKPQPADEVTLLFEHLSRDGGLSYAGGRRLAWGEGPELLLGLDEPGDYVFGVTVETIGGEAAHGLLEYRVGADPGLRALLEQGSDFAADDLLGTWEMIEAEALQSSGAIKPLGVLVAYERHPEKPALLLSTMTAPQRNPDFAARELVYLDLRLVKHLRSFALGTAGLEIDPLAVDFSVNLVSLHAKDGRPLMLTRNKVSGLNYAFVKVGGHAGGHAGQHAGQPPAGRPGGQGGPSGPGGFGQQAPAPALTFDGTWQRQDGVVLQILGNQFQVSQFGMVLDAGVFMVQGDVLTSQSAVTGEYEQFRFALEPQVLRLQDGWGNVYVYQRVE
jgi:hypothetical protein